MINASAITNVTLRVSSDDGSICYINDKQIGYDPECDGMGWDYVTSVDPGVLVDGNNIIACSAKEKTGAEGLDAELESDTEGMLVNRGSDWVYYHQWDFCTGACDPADQTCEYGHYINTCGGYNENVIANGHMESMGDWRYSENGTSWSGGYTTDDKYSGLQSYRISYPWATSSSSGYYGAITQTITGFDIIGMSHLRGCVKDSYTGGTSGYHFKQVLIDGTVVWEEDVAGDEGGWICFNENIAPELVAKAAVDITLRVYDKKGVSSFGVDVYWDDIMLTPWYEGTNMSHVCSSDYCTFIGDDNYCWICNVTRIKLAKKLDSIFIDEILKIMGDMIGLVGYGDAVCDSTNLTTNKTQLNESINAYLADCGATCISCAIQKGIEILNNSPEDKDKYMVVMSDGEANMMINGTRDPAGAQAEAIAKACEAYENYSIVVYAVGFGVDAGAETLKNISECGHGEFYHSDDPDELEQIYINIAEKITFRAQSASVNITNSTLHPDSYIEFNYTPIVIPFEYGCIDITYEFKRFGGNVSSPKSGSFTVPPGVAVVDAKVTSYSAEYWTDSLTVNGVSVYRLWDYGSSYRLLGDPYIVQIPANLAVSGLNNLSIDTGGSPSTPMGGSPDDRVIYTFILDPSVSHGPYEEPFRKAEGSNSTIWYDIDQDGIVDGNITALVGPVPSDEFDPDEDAIDDAFIRLLDQLNFYDDKNPDMVVSSIMNATHCDGCIENPMDIMLPPEIQFEVSRITSVRSLWGPIVIKLVVWM